MVDMGFDLRERTGGKADIVRRLNLESYERSFLPRLSDWAGVVK